MRFLIFGAGALGQGLGGLLACAGHKVDLLVRPRFVGAIQQEGLHVSGILGNFHAKGPSLRPLSQLEEATGYYDYVLLTTKAYDTAAAVQQLTALTDRFKTVVSMQNGCGNVEQVERAFGQDKTLGARVITGFAISRPGWVDITVIADAIHIGSSRRGTPPETARVLAQELSQAGHPTEAMVDIHQSLFAKLLYNCALNPLGAILGVHYGALAEQMATKSLMNAVIDETFAVITALGGSLPWPDADSYKQVFYQTLIPATANHRASMLQDLENGKPTEVEALVGYVSRQGREHRIPTPLCDILTALVKFKEKQVIAKAS